jgi:hypothetical protein
MRSLFIILINFICTSCFCQCLPLDGYLQNQYEVDYIKQIYPNCTVIKGSLNIGGNIKNLDSLNNFTKIEGNLSFNFADSLIDISGLNTIDTITGTLFLNDLRNIAILNDFKNLKYCNKIFITDNPKLNTINTFNSLNSVSSQILISNNNGLKSIYGFKKLDTAGFIEILSNPQLQLIEGFNNMRMAIKIEINNLDSLKELNAFTKLLYVNILSIIRCEKLMKWTVGNELLKIGNLRLESIALDSISGFEKLESADNISIYALIQTKKPPYFRSLKKVKNIDFLFNPFIEIVNRFPQLDTVYEDLVITKDRKILAIHDFNRLKIVYGRITINDHIESLKSLSGFNELKYANGIFINATNNLITFSPFGKLEEVNHLEVRYLRDGIYSLENFKSLKKVNKTLHIFGISKLDDISFIDQVNIDSVQSLYLYGNTNLSICSNPTICKYLETHDTLINQIIIYDNDVGCNSVAEIRSKCPSSSTQLLIDRNIKLFPNPVSSILNIDIPYQNNVCEIFSADGRSIYRRKCEDYLDVTNLDVGMYYLKISNKVQVHSFKFVKE